MLSGLQIKVKHDRLLGRVYTALDAITVFQYFLTLVIVVVDMKSDVIF